MSAPAAADASAPPKAKSKKMLVIIMAVVLLLVAGAAAWFFLLRAPAEEGEDGAPAAAHAEVKLGTPPVYMPMDNMVVNLADPGGERYAQVGITVSVVDQKTADAVKAHLPTIRSAALLLISQSTSDDLLTKEGKQKLAQAILREVSTPLGYEVEEPEEAEEDPAPKKKGKKKAAAPASPILGVLFTSFIIQ